MYKRLSSQRVQENTWDENRRDISVNFEDGSLNGSQGRTHVKLFCAKTHHIKDYTSIQTIAATELRINRSICMGYLLSVVKHSPFPHAWFHMPKGADRDFAIKVVGSLHAVSSSSPRPLGPVLLSISGNLKRRSDDSEDQLVTTRRLKSIRVYRTLSTLPLKDRKRHLLRHKRPCGIRVTRNGHITILGICIGHDRFCRCLFPVLCDTNKGAPRTYLMCVMTLNKAGSVRSAGCASLAHLT